MEEFLSRLLSLSLGGSLIAALVFLLRFPKRLPKSVCYYAWLLVLLRLILPVPGRLAVPGAPTPPAQVQSEITAPPAAETVPFFPDSRSVEYTPVRPVSRPAASPAAPAEAPPAPSDAQILALVWVLGFLHCLGSRLIRYFRFRYTLSKTLIPPRESDLALYDSLTGPRRPRLYRTTAVDTPMLLGLLHPTLLLPDRTYFPETLRCVFIHELTHYRRRDLWYKWFAVPVLAVHWFNPLTVLMAREIDRCCELSCDELLLREMDRDQRRCYGQTLLVLAARSTPARTMLSTSFATEKKNLKERLVHIMNFSPKSKKAILAAAILLIAVAACCILFGPQAAPADAANLPSLAGVEPPLAVAEPTQAETLPEPTFRLEGDALVVSTVDELLAAIGSDTKIILEPGVYDLTQARDYGGSPASNFYRWTEENDGFQLELLNIQNLTVTGRDQETCEIVTAPRYAAVLAFEGCSNIVVKNITAGHTEGPGSCVGAVVLANNASNLKVMDCILYGCGTYGMEAHGSDLVFVTNTDIKECSLGAAVFTECTSSMIHSCRVYDCGKESGAADMFYFNRCKNSGVMDCSVSGNDAATLLSTTTCKDIWFLSNTVTENHFGFAYFDINGASPVVGGCFFPDVDDSLQMIARVPLTNGNDTLREEGTVLSMDGRELGAAQLKAMTYASTGFTLPVLQEPAPTESAREPAEISTDGTAVVSASTVDELLAAIAPNTTVVLAEGTYDLSTASDYGTGWTDCYRWSDEFDGYELEIMKVENFHIKGAGQNKTILTAVPRYADVLVFTGCSDISVQGITAGHTIEPGYCTGGVLRFANCAGGIIDSCGLYGCGILGVMADGSRDFRITNTEIYDCTYGAVQLMDCTGFAFDECSIHDCPMPYFTLLGSQEITLNGEPIY